MTARQRRWIIVLGALVLGIAGFVVWSQTPTVRIQRLLADIPGGRIDGDPKAQAALAQLRAMGPEAVPIILKQLDSADCPDGCTHALIEIGPKAASALLEYLVKARKPRLIASAALANMERLGPEHLDKLLDLWRFDSDSLIRSRCIVAAAKIDPQVTGERCGRQIEADLQSANLARVHAAVALDAIGPVNEQMAALIEQAKQDPRLSPFMPKSTRHN